MGGWLEERERRFEEVSQELQLAKRQIAYLQAQLQQARAQSAKESGGDSTPQPEALTAAAEPIWDVTPVPEETDAIAAVRSSPRKRRRRYQIPHPEIVPT